MKLAVLAVLATVLLAPQISLAAEPDPVPENPCGMLEPGHEGPHDGHTRRGIVNVEDPELGDRNRENNPDYRVVLTGSEIPSYLMLRITAHGYERMTQEFGADKVLASVMWDTELDAVEAQAIIDALSATAAELAETRNDNKRRALCHVSHGPAGAQIYGALEQLADTDEQSAVAAHAKLRGQLALETFAKLDWLLEQRARGSTYAIPDHRQRKTAAEAEAYVARACARLGFDYSEVGQ